MRRTRARKQKFDGVLDDARKRAMIMGFADHKATPASRSGNKKQRMCRVSVVSKISHTVDTE
jgi:hypothetical protein